MISTRVLRGVLGVVAAVALSAGPAVAADGTATGATATVTAATIQPAATCTPGARACPIRITFASGAYSGQAHAQMAGINSQKWFVVHARAGQAMVVVVKGAGPTRGVVYFPNGQTRGQPGGRVFDGILPSTGDYRIKVTESSMGSAWSGRVDVVTLIY